MSQVVRYLRAPDCGENDEDEIDLDGCSPFRVSLNSSGTRLLYQTPRGSWIEDLGEGANCGRYRQVSYSELVRISGESASLISTRATCEPFGGYYQPWPESRHAHPATPEVSAGTVATGSKIRPPLTDYETPVNDLLKRWKPSQAALVKYTADKPKSTAGEGGTASPVLGIETAYCVSYAWEDKSKAVVDQLCKDARASGAFRSCEMRPAWALAIASPSSCKKSVRETACS